jgi:hypothetical protein
MYLWKYVTDFDESLYWRYTLKYVKINYFHTGPNYHSFTWGSNHTLQFRQNGLLSIKQNVDLTNKHEFYKEK